MTPLVNVFMLEQHVFNSMVEQDSRYQRAQNQRLQQGDQTFWIKHWPIFQKVA
jgi:hypothetical protein